MKYTVSKKTRHYSCPQLQTLTDFQQSHQRTQTSNELMIKYPTTPQTRRCTTFSNVKCQKTSDNLKQISCLSINKLIDYNNINVLINTSQCIFKISSSGSKAGMDTPTPLINGMAHISIRRCLPQIIHILHLCLVGSFLNSEQDSANNYGHDCSAAVNLA